MVFDSEVEMSNEDGKISTTETKEVAQLLPIEEDQESPTEVDMANDSHTEADALTDRHCTRRSVRYRGRSTISHNAWRRSTTQRGCTYSGVCGL